MRKYTRLERLQWYDEYLKSPHFTVQRKIARFFSLGFCGVCYLRIPLQAHHLWYGVKGKWYEFLFLRMVCDRDHRRVQFFLGYKLTGAVALITYYYSIKFLYLLTVVLVRTIIYICRWLYREYVI